MTGMNFDPYQVLGVPPTASRTQITRAYRERLRAHHPDTRPAQASEAADDGLQEVLAAYALLRDPARRAEYDRRAAGRTTKARVRVVRNPTDGARPASIDVPITYRREAPDAPSVGLWAGPVRRHMSRAPTETRPPTAD